jgi:hypothetical protein
LAGAVQVFELYITDDRHSIPTLRLVTASDQDGARELAESIYRESPHHLGVEVWEKKNRVFAFGTRLAGR